MSITIDQLRLGDVIAVHGSDWLDRSIEDITHSKYSHVALCIGPNALIEAQGMSRVHYQDTGVYAGHADVYRHNSLPPPVAKKIITYAERHLNQTYDYLLIGWELVRYWLGILLPFQENHSVICSTLVADSYREAGYNICPKMKYPSPADITSGDFFINMGPLVG